MNVRLTKEQKIQILNGEDLYKVMRQILMRENKISRAKEHFWVVGLNKINRIMFIELVSLGSISAAVIKPPEIFRMAIYKLATGIILVHNHPSGGIEASPHDIALTNKFKKSGKLLEIPVMDHLIITENDFRSIIKES
ncbi:MAG: JAB domain-containing protein [Bacteroidota bacterium]